MQFYYCNSDSHSPCSFQSMSPVEFYRTSGAGSGKMLRDSGSHWSLHWQQALQPHRAEFFPNGNGWSILLRSVQRRRFLLWPKRYKACFRYLVSRPCDFTESQKWNGWQEQAMAANLKLLSFSNTSKIDHATFNLKLCVFKHMAMGRAIGKGFCAHNV